jgi:hypothetical protein
MTNYLVPVLMKNYLMERVLQERRVPLVPMELVPMPPLMLQRNLLHFLPPTMRHLKLHYLPRMTLLMMRPRLPLRMLRLLPLVLRLALLLV